MYRIFITNTSIDEVPIINAYEKKMWKRFVKNLHITTSTIYHIINFKHYYGLKCILSIIWIF